MKSFRHKIIVIATMVSILGLEFPTGSDLFLFYKTLIFLSNVDYSLHYLLIAGGWVAIHKYMNERTYRAG